MNLRLLAARIINAVTEGESLSDALQKALPALKDPRDRAFVQALCFGICRFYFRLDVLLSLLLTKPMKAKDSDVHALLMVGLYQLIYMRVPAHAAVAETVTAAEKLKKPWARGLVNAILREYLRSQTVYEPQLEADLESQYAHPIWMINAIKAAWPTDWDAILHANNAHPPFTLRVNLKKMAREAYLKKLTTASIEAQVVSVTPAGLTLSEPVPVESLPLFKEGVISVQDSAAQLAASLLKLEPGQRVLDACAAPGGKLMHILESGPVLAKCIALEKDSKRLALIEENLTRLGLQADCVCTDAAEIDKWWDGVAFDRILLDAPCSASGVVRRHPDIKLLREAVDITHLAKEQLRLLESLWRVVKPGGLLLYATCSIFPEENTQVLKQFLARHKEAREDKIHADWGIACEVGRQILPGMGDMDGFYYARLQREA